MRSLSVAIMVLWAACGGDTPRADLICGAGQVPRNGFCVPSDGDVFVGDVGDFELVTGAPDTRGDAPDTSPTEPDTQPDDVTSEPDTSATDTSATDTSAADGDVVSDGDASDAPVETSVSDATSPSDTTPPNPGPPCYGVPYEGCCAPGDAALFCYLGRLEAQDCFEDGCGWTGDELGYYCAGSGEDPSGHFARACPPAAVRVACPCGEDRCRPDSTCGAPCPCGPEAAFVARAQVVQHIGVATNVALSDAPAGPEVCGLASSTTAAPAGTSALRLGFVPNIDSAAGCAASTSVVATYDRWNAIGERSYSDPAERITASWGWAGDACVVSLTLDFPGGNAWSAMLTIPATPAQQCQSL